jgi:hypothetical protein
MVLGVRNALLVLVLIASIVSAVIVAQAKSAKTWCYPHDAKAVLSQEPPHPYSAPGLPNGVVGTFTTYRKPGLRVLRPGRDGYWQFKKITKLFYKGKLFALEGGAACFSLQGNEMGCIHALVIYDENADG